MVKNFASLEPDFFNFVRSLSHFEDGVVIVGGWLPYLYSKYYWKNFREEIIFTMDIDIGVRLFFKRDYPEKLDVCFRKSNYPEEPVYDVESIPVRFFLKNDEKQKIPIDVITADPDPGQFQRLTGSQIEVINSLDNFDLLVDEQNTIVLNCDFEGQKINLYVPHPAIYFFHKGITFNERSQKPGRDHKFKKDLWSIYFVLANTPDVFKEELYQRIKSLKDHYEYQNFVDNLKMYFKDKESQGTLAVHSFYPEMGKFFRERIVEVVGEFLEKN